MSGVGNKRAGSKRCARERTKSSSSESDDCLIDSVTTMKNVQKLRTPNRGVKFVDIENNVKQWTPESNKNKSKGHIGGLIDMASIKNLKTEDFNDAFDTGIGAQFSVETNKRDEDEHMMKYIEDEVSKRKGTTLDDDFDCSNESLNPDDLALQSLPEHLRVSSAVGSEEMLSNQMLSGIPEVDLGIYTKIMNIEATENAKHKMLMDQSKIKDAPSKFVPMNMAVNFAQHNRFNLEDDTKQVKQMRTKKPETRITSSEKATDDYHYERFRKQFRRF